MKFKNVFRFQSIKIVNIFKYKYSDTNSKMKFKEKYSMDDIINIIDDFHKMKIAFDQLPLEFQKLEDKIIKLPAKPKEPQDYECCGSGCRPCVWDVYEKKKEIYDEGINEIYNKLNQDKDML
jgi:hypothetical protein